jgi:ABC-type uncharacterized transport system ATPase subunit
MKLLPPWTLTLKDRFRTPLSTLHQDELLLPSRKLKRSISKHNPYTQFCLTSELISSHRLSTITTSDQIVVLHKGEIIERGTHSELLALQGRYHAMWEKQTTIEKKKLEKLEKGDASSEEILHE